MPHADAVYTNTSTDMRYLYRHGFAKHNTQNSRSDSRFLATRFDPYTNMDVLLSTLTACWCRSSKNKIGIQESNSAFSFREDKAKLVKEIDIVSVVNNLKELKTLVNDLINNRVGIIDFNMPDKSQSHDNLPNIQEQSVIGRYNAE